jgi:hypothetical protein
MKHVAVFMFTLAAMAAEKPRVFIADSRSGDLGIFGGSRPITAEIVRHFRDKCPQVEVVNVKDSADYSVTLDSAFKGLAARGNQIAVFRQSGTLLHSGGTRKMGNAVKDACGAIVKDVAVK